MMPCCGRDSDPVVTGRVRVDKVEVKHTIPVYDDAKSAVTTVARATSKGARSAARVTSEGAKYVFQKLFS